jgi:hypothetical protein
MKYFHIAFNTPFGPGTYFYRGDNHPFMPKEYDERTEKIASNLSIQYAKNISPTAIIYTSIIELPLEVAKARWPEDFEKSNPLDCLRDVVSAYEHLPPVPTPPPCRTSKANLG